ncbi:methylase involved in ubiquinone/menaquinone biosynthesis [Chthonomonas calidirosea]|uniref:Methylase involved in ubiquinone/menaquinone biosynthesis n=1 Tax=Chthonomonas calidirosea (strain DSM 23976 / ICMP 18418 / T49) TaxID=1303518 RepID=S0EVN5_CHTCT|nr:class I SAM-dependent methyltransferase [Chthonomonas calidirosea]CCW35486.1 Methylase involved in ubiquinone/menaquinone biosynthesis [Chthonomonas calidirosea T49]CEK20129.1 methylase involved in ubiquinone/menaquinone biosynthesis [Chthonomonas calidirosea]
MGIMTNNTETDAGWITLEYCPLCNSRALRPLYITHDRHYGIPGEYRLDRCQSCTLVFLNPMPNEAALTRLYPSTYYAYQEFESTPTARMRLKRLVKSLFMMHIGTKDPTFSKPGRLLDIGCGSGQFLYKMRQQGWEVYGVEVNEQAVAVGRAAELDIRHGNLLEAHFEANYFDYIRANHSFEHIVNPHETLEEIHRILKPEGKLLIGVPNIAGWNAQLFRKYWWYLGVPVHPYSYSVRTLTYLLQQHHFVVERVTYNSDYSGILGSLQIFLNRKNGKLSTEGLVFNNYALRVIAQRTAKLLDRLKLGDAIEITAHKEVQPT